MFGGNKWNRIQDGNEVNVRLPVALVVVGIGGVRVPPVPMAVLGAVAVVVGAVVLGAVVVVLLVLACRTVVLLLLFALLNLSQCLPILLQLVLEGVERFERQF
jgi:hypothetical protein